MKAYSIVGAACGIVLAAALAFPAAAQIHAVALGAIAEPVSYGIVSASGSFGQYDSRTFVPGATSPRSFAEAMAAEHLQLGAELRAALTQGLTRAGFVVATPASADAALDIVFEPMSVVYSDAALGDDLMPVFAVTFSLTDTRSKSVLAKERILYGETGERVAHTLYPDASYRFTSPDALLADPKSAAEGLRAGLPRIAAEIVALLKR